MSMKTKFARKAVKTTAKHTAHGAASKLKRNPLRTTTLLALGAAVGVVVGLLVGRKTGGGSQPEFESASASGSAALSETLAEPDPITPQPPVAGTGSIPG
jgi:hypothetical protein